MSRFEYSLALSLLEEGPLAIGRYPFSSISRGLSSGRERKLSWDGLVLASKSY